MAGRLAGTIAVGFALGSGTRKTGVVIVVREADRANPSHFVSLVIKLAFADGFIVSIGSNRPITVRRFPRS